MTGRPRTYSVEPTESELALLKGKPQQFVDVPDIDVEDTDKEYACAEYAKEISNYLKQREVYEGIDDSCSNNRNVALTASLTFSPAVVCAIREV